MNRDAVFHIAPANSVAGDIQPDCGYIVISSEEKFRSLSDYSNILLLHFADTEEKNRSVAFSLDDVEKIYRFIDANPFSDFFVTCDAGESRSPAVVAGILRLLERDDDYIWRSSDYRPNTLVYKTMLEPPAVILPDVASELEMMEGMTPDEYRQYRKELKKRSRNRNDVINEVSELVNRVRESGDNTVARKIVTKLLNNEGVPLDCIKTSEDDTYTYAEFEKYFNDIKAVMTLYYNPDSNYWQIRARIDCNYSCWESPEKMLITTISIPQDVSAELIDLSYGRAFMLKCDGLGFLQEYEYIEKKYRKIENAASFVASQIENSSSPEIQ